MTESLAVQAYKKMARKAIAETSEWVDQFAETLREQVQEGNVSLKELKGLVGQHNEYLGTVVEMLNALERSVVDGGGSWE